MKKYIFSWIAALATIGSVSYSDDVDLSKRVDKLENRIAVLETKVKGVNSWSCQAICVLWERGYGPKYFNLTSTTSTAGEAFQNLQNQCMQTNETAGKYAHWFVSLEYSAESTARIATMLNSCVKN